MTRNHIGRLRGRILIAAAAVLAPLAFASSAAATEHHPTGPYTPYADCPLSNSAVEICTVAHTTSGEVTIGNKTVEITNPLKLQGGLHENSSKELEFYAAENGETLSKTEETVPGGLTGLKAPESWPALLKEIFNEDIINKGITGVTEITELAKPASAIKLNTTNFILETGVALQLPVKIKLNNLFLGGECYIAGGSKPIVLNLTTGTTSPPEPNKPITGTPGTGEFLAEGNIIQFTGTSLVDNAFAVEEGAKGCAPILPLLFSGLVDPLVNEVLGVPAKSKAGENTAKLNGPLEEALAPAVKESE